MRSSENQNTQNENNAQQLDSGIDDPGNLLKIWNHEEITEITEYLPIESVRNLALTCHSLFYNSIKLIFDQRKLETLAHHILVKPNEDKMEAMLNCEPTLVNAVIKKVIVGKDDYEKTFLNNTIFQLACGEKDTDMCLAMKPFFVKVYGSEEAAIQEMDRQRNEKFAENKEEDAKEDERVKIHLKALLEPVIKAITKEEFNSGVDTNNKLILSDATMTAIGTFRNKFANSQPKTIEKGPHFRDNTLLETLNAYSNAKKQWNRNRNYINKCALFEDGVLSCVLLYLPRNVIQMINQGLENLDMGEKFLRRETLRDSENNFYLVVRGPSVDFSLNGSCINILFGVDRSPWGGAAGRTPVERAAELYQNLCRTQASNLQNLCSSPSLNRSLGA